MNGTLQTKGLGGQGWTRIYEAFLGPLQLKCYKSVQAINKRFKANYFKINNSKTIKQTSNLVSDIRSCLCELVAQALTCSYERTFTTIPIKMILITTLILVKRNAYESSLNEKLHLNVVLYRFSKNVSLNNFIVFKQTSHVSKKSQRLLKLAFQNSPFHFKTTRSAITIEEVFFQSRYNNLWLTTT